MAVLLLLLAGYLGHQSWPYYAHYFEGITVVKPSGPLPPANAISNLTVTRGGKGKLMASFNYAYTGRPQGANLSLLQVAGSATVPPMEWHIKTVKAVPGEHRFEGEIVNPSVHDMYLTQKVIVRLSAAYTSETLATSSLDHRIQWPDPMTLEVEGAVASGTHETLVQKAADLIDTGRQHQLQQARKLLQTLVDKSPRTDAAYVELARVAMKTNFNDSGLAEAEALIKSALQIRPDSANAKILLGYVYAHQGRYKEAEALLEQAAAVNPPNLWLWANWGQLLVMQGKPEAGIAKYREAIQRPPTRNTYDRARWDAYANLLQLEQQREDMARVEALHKQRVQDYPGAFCFSVDYARFLVLQRGDTAASQVVLQEAPSPECAESHKRLVHGLVRYVAWAHSNAGVDKENLLRQARVFHTVNPALFYELAQSDRGVPVARQLIAAGEKIGMQDERQLDALTYALRDGQVAVARRLLQLGASPAAEVGAEKMPVALVPVINRNFEGIRLMRRAGVDYAKLRYQGTTAVEYARQQGDTKLLEVLDPKSGKV